MRKHLRAGASLPGVVGPGQQIVSTSGKTPAPGEVLNVPGVPAGVPLPSGTVITPQDLSTLDSVIAYAIQKAFDAFSIYTQIKPIDNYDVIAVPMAANVAVRLDALGSKQTMRRAIMIFNPSAAQPIWVNKDGNVNVNNGIPIGINNGSYQAAIHERNAHWGLCTVNNTAIVAWYS